MFIGHYAICFAIKRVERRVSLGMLFIAVQLLDILLFAFSLAGFEKFTLIESTTAAIHFRLDYYPWSHSLFAGLIWSLLAYCFFMYLLPVRGSKANRVAVLMAIAVFSHWILDFVVHTPGLPVFSQHSTKLGLGLWNSTWLSWGLESLILLLAVLFYMSGTRVRRKKGKNAFLILALVLIVVNAFNIFGPFLSSSLQSDTGSFALSAVFAYFLLAWVAHRFEDYRA